MPLSGEDLLKALQGMFGADPASQAAAKAMARDRARRQQDTSAFRDQFFGPHPRYNGRYYADDQRRIIGYGAHGEPVYEAEFVVTASEIHPLTPPKKA